RTDRQGLGGARVTPPRNLSAYKFVTFLLTARPSHQILIKFSIAWRGKADTMKLLLLSLVLTLSCTTVYYDFWEALGKEKRDLLKSQILAANNQQADVQEELQDTLTRIKTEYGFEGGEIETTYRRLAADFDRAK